MSKQLFDELISELQSGNEAFVESKLSELTDEQIDALFGEAQSFKSIGLASSDKVVIASVSNLRENYLKKLITTSMIGFLFQMKDEFTVSEEDLSNPPNKDDFMEEVQSQQIPDEFNKDYIYNRELVNVFRSKFKDDKVDSIEDMERALTEDELLNVSVKANEELKKLLVVDKKLNMMKYNDAIHYAIEKQSEQERAVINKFLENLFKFDENKHLKNGYNPIENDPERVDINELKGTHAVYDNIPPNDTYCRFKAYYEINYEKMRDAVRNIYNVKPDLEHAMIVYDVVDSQDEANTFVNKYGASSKFDIITFNLNKWALLGSFKENRERIDYYNKRNNIIKTMLEQQEADNTLGEDIMKNRVKSAKVKAERVFGKDSPQFDEYKKLAGHSVDEMNASTVVEELGEDKIKVTKEAIIDTQTGEELKLDEDGIPSNALEVPVTTINAKTGKVSKTRFFTRTDEKNSN